MKARHFLKMSVVALLLLPATLFAQTIDPVDPGKGLPDLVPADLAVDKDCRIVVTIQNNGTAIVPDAGYSRKPPDSSSVQMYNDGAPWRGIVLGGLDPEHLSQPVGGVVSYTWFPDLALKPGTHVVSVDVDNNNSISESDELNNSLTEKLTCQQQPPPPQLPDLQPTDLTLDADCRIDVTITNNGPEAVPESGYSLSPPGDSGVQMYNDGATWGGGVLGGFDPVPHLSQPAGGAKTFKWFSSLPLPAGSHVVKLDVDTNSVIAEGNEANNSITKTLNCQRQLPDLVPTNITLQQTGPAVDSPCQVLVTLMNNGTGIVPDAAYAQVPQAPAIQMWKGGAGFGGAILGLVDLRRVLQPAGATLVYLWMGVAMLVPPGEHTLQVDVDIRNSLVESNEANNTLTKTLTCGNIIAPPTTNP